jgi:hypothetical protein
MLPTLLAGTSPKNKKPSTPDSLTKTSQGANVELSEGDLDRVTGGVVNKVKTSDKQTEAIVEFIKG